MERVAGVVKWFGQAFDREDGRKVRASIGFIAGDDGRDYFVHWSEVEPVERRGREGWRGLERGERVSYVPAESDRGLRATDVKRIKKEDVPNV